MSDVYLKAETCRKIVANFAFSCRKIDQEQSLNSAKIFAIFSGVTDGRTDRLTDRIAIGLYQYRAVRSCSVLTCDRNNYTFIFIARLATLVSRFLVLSVEQRARRSSLIEALKVLPAT